MAWVLQCDRCKKIFEHKEGYRNLLLSYYRYSEELRIQNKGFDLCPECMDYIVNYLQNREGKELK